MIKSKKNWAHRHSVPFDFKSIKSHTCLGTDLTWFGAAEEESGGRFIPMRLTAGILVESGSLTN